MEKISVATSDINTSGRASGASPSPRERDSFAMVLADVDGRKVAVVKATDVLYKVWEFEYTPSDGKTSPTLELVRERVIDMSGPDSLDDSDSGASSGSSPSTPRHPSVIKPLENLCRYWNGHLMLGSPQELQIFHLDTLALVQRCLASSVDNTGSGNEFFLSAQATGGSVVSATKSGICLLSVVANDGPASSTFPAPLVLKTSSAVSELIFPSTANDAILAGTMDGFVAALRVVTPEVFVRDLVAQSEPFIAGCSLRAHPSPFVEKQHEIDPARNPKRVNCIARRGKFTAVGHEGDCVTIWAYSTGMSQPVFLKEFPMRGPVVDVAVHSTSMNALVRSGLGKDASQEMVVINLLGLSEAADEAIKQNLAAVASASTSTTAGAPSAAVAAAITTAEFLEMKDLMKQMIVENRRLADLVAKSLEDRNQLADQLNVVRTQLAQLVNERKIPTLSLPE